MTQEPYAPIHSFKFNVQSWPVLERFSSPEFNQGIDTMLQRGGYVLEAGSSDALRIYASEEKVDRYLVVWALETYHFIFYIPDDQSLNEWRRQYEHMRPALVLKTFLPEQPKPVQGITFQMDLKKAFLSR